MTNPSQVLTENASRAVLAWVGSVYDNPRANPHSFIVIPNEVKLPPVSHTDTSGTIELIQIPSDQIVTDELRTRTDQWVSYYTTHYVDELVEGHPEIHPIALPNP